MLFSSGKRRIVAVGTMTVALVAAGIGGTATAAPARSVGDVLHDTGHLAAHLAEADGARSTPKLTLRGAHGTRQQINGGVDVTPDALSDTDEIVRSSESAEQHIVVLRDGASPDITWTMAGSPTLTVDEIGGVLVGTTARISRPWAVDAKGHKLATSFSVSGSTVTQHLDLTDAVFPVVADPYIVETMWSYAVYFTWDETQWLDSYSPWGSAICGAITRIQPWAGVGCAVDYGWRASTLKAGIKRNRCFKTVMYGAGYANGGPTNGGISVPGTWYHEHGLQCWSDPYAVLMGG